MSDCLQYPMVTIFSHRVLRYACAHLTQIHLTAVREFQGEETMVYVFMTRNTLLMEHDLTSEHPYVANVLSRCNADRLRSA